MEETAENRLKRLRMRSWRRGIKELDLILGAFADKHLAELESADLEVYEALLSENDHDLYAWVSGRDTPPDRFEPLISRISEGTGHPI